MVISQHLQAAISDRCNAIHGFIIPLEGLADIYALLASVPALIQQSTLAVEGLFVRHRVNRLKALIARTVVRPLRAVNVRHSIAVPLNL